MAIHSSEVLPREQWVGKYRVERDEHHEIVATTAQTMQLKKKRRAGMGRGEVEEVRREKIWRHMVLVDTPADADAYRQMLAHCNETIRVASDTAYRNFKAQVADYNRSRK